MGADLAQQVLAVAGLGDDVEAGVVEHAHRALAQQHRVVGDHDAHGISARSVVPCRAGCGCRAAAERGDPVGEAAQAGPAGGVGAAAAVVAHLDDQRCRPGATPRPRLGRRRVAGHVGQGLGDGEVRGRLDRAGQALAGNPLQRHRHAGARGQRAQRRLEAALGQHRGVDAARQLAQLVRRRGELVRGLVEQRAASGSRCPRARQAQVEREPDEPLLGAVVEVALEPPARLVGRRDHPRPRRPQLALAS